MSHVGNDVVDLKTPEAMGKSADKRFIKRVLNPDEQETVFNSHNPDSFLWAFWAAKESAFKAVNKSYPDVSSAPRRYPIVFNLPSSVNTLFGIVNTPHGAVSVKVFLNKEYVHCIGIDLSFDDLEKIVFGLKEIEPDQKAGNYSLPERESIMVRRFAKSHIASLFGRNSNDIHIMRNQGIAGQGPPTLFYKGKRDTIDISLSHDGRFAAYAFLATS